jgi:hypothetical protein
MAAVVFKLTTNAGLDEHEARDLAEQIGRQRTLAAQSAARKILEQAKRDVDRGETSTNVVLDRDELQAVLAVLREGVPDADTPATVHLRTAIERELAQT